MLNPNRRDLCTETTWQGCSRTSQAAVAMARRAGRAGPRRQDRDSSGAALPGALESSGPGAMISCSGAPGLSHPLLPPLPLLWGLLCPSGRLCLPLSLVLLTPTHPSKLCLDTRSAGAPTPPHAQTLTTPQAHLYGDDSPRHMGYPYTCFSALRSCKHLRADVKDVDLEPDGPGLNPASGSVTLGG